MRRSRLCVAAAVLVFGTPGTRARGQIWTQQAKLLAETPGEYVFFGEPVAVHASTLMVGENVGPVRVFSYDGSGWHQTQILDPGYPGPISIDMDGEAAIFGRMMTFYGEARIVEQTAGAWQFATTFSAPSTSYVFYGADAGLSGSTAIVGAPQGPGACSFSGVALVYEKVGGAWSGPVLLAAEDGARDDEFGCSVDVSGSAAIVGANAHHCNGEDSGAAYVFEKSAGGWQQVAKLLPADVIAESRFGNSVAISGSRAIVGAPRNNPAGSHSGSAYVFERTADGWEQTARLVPHDAGSFDYVGECVAICGSRAVVSAWGDDDTAPNSGAAYIFEDTGSGWEEVAKLVAVDGDEDDRFGSSVALSDALVVAGAHWDDQQGYRSGSAYVFIPEPATLGLLGAAVAMLLRRRRRSRRR